MESMFIIFLKCFSCLDELMRFMFLPVVCCFVHATWLTHLNIYYHFHGVGSCKLLVLCK